MKKNLIFLDFDGVINSVESMIRKKDAREGMPVFSREDRSDWPDTVLVNRLKELIEKTNSSIVISSTWRYRGKDYCAKVLGSFGIPENLVIGVTPRNTGTCRGKQIQQWLNENYLLFHEFDNFIIIDDDSDMAHLKHRLVQTSNRVGLQDSDIEKAIQLLKGDYLNV